MNFISFILIAMFIEAIINVFKPLWDNSAKQLTVPEYISMGLGVVISVVAKFNMLEGLVVIESTILLYILYVMTGIALGRGPSFIYDLWKKLRDAKTDSGAGQ